MNIKEIVEDWLTDKVFDGLCYEECGCGLGDLFACDDVNDKCVAAFVRKCKGETCPDHSDECEISVGGDCYYPAEEAV